MLRVEFDKQNAARVTQLLAKLRGAADPGVERLRLFTHLGVAVLRWVDQNFASAGSLVGGWKPLAPNTVFGRRQGSDVPLSDTGTLRRSFTAAATDEDLRVGTAVQIARYHQFGTDPYIIEPRNKKALAFPMSPLGVRSWGGGFYAKRVQRGRKGAATPRATGIPRGGLATAGQIRGAGFAVPGGKGPIQTFGVFRRVHHPGLAARRMLPKASEIAEVVAAVAQDWLRTLKGGG